MIDVALAGYFAIAVVVAASLLVEAPRMRWGRQPVRHSVPTAAVAGLSWPVLLVGLIEIGTMALIAAAMSSSRADDGLDVVI